MCFPFCVLMSVRRTPITLTPLKGNRSKLVQALHVRAQVLPVRLRTLALEDGCEPLPVHGLGSVVRLDLEPVVVTTSEAPTRELLLVVAEDVRADDRLTRLVTFIAAALVRQVFAAREIGIIADDLPDVEVVVEHLQADGDQDPICGLVAVYVEHDFPFYPELPDEVHATLPKLLRSVYLTVVVLDICTMRFYRDLRF